MIWLWLLWDCDRNIPLSAYWSCGKVHLFFIFPLSRNSLTNSNQKGPNNLHRYTLTWTDERRWWTTMVITVGHRQSSTKVTDFFLGISDPHETLTYRYVPYRHVHTRWLRVLSIVEFSFDVVTLLCIRLLVGNHGSSIATTIHQLEREK